MWWKCYSTHNNELFWETALANIKSYGLLPISMNTEQHLITVHYSCDWGWVQMSCTSGLKPVLMGKIDGNACIKLKVRISAVTIGLDLPLWTVQLQLKPRPCMHAPIAIHAARGRSSFFFGFFRRLCAQQILRITATWRIWIFGTAKTGEHCASNRTEPVNLVFGRVSTHGGQFASALLRRVFTFSACEGVSPWLMASCCCMSWLLTAKVISWSSSYLPASHGNTGRRSSQESSRFLGEGLRDQLFRRVRCPTTPSDWGELGQKP